MTQIFQGSSHFLEAHSATVSHRMSWPYYRTVPHSRSTYSSTVPHNRSTTYDSYLLTGDDQILAKNLTTVHDHILPSHVHFTISDVI